MKRFVKAPDMLGPGSLLVAGRQCALLHRTPSGLHTAPSNAGRRTQNKHK